MCIGLYDFVKKWEKNVVVILVLYYFFRKEDKNGKR